jgi:hypothetical protein
MDESSIRDWGGKELPRWIQIPVGVILGLFTILCGFDPGSRHRFRAIARLCLGAGKVLRLITGRKKRQGLLGPRTLRIVSVSLLVLPIVGVFTGYHHETVAIFQALMYFVGFFGLRAFARQREAKNAKNREQDLS